MRGPIRMLYKRCFTVFSNIFFWKGEWEAVVVKNYEGLINEWMNEMEGSSSGKKSESQALRPEVYFVAELRETWSKRILSQLTSNRDIQQLPEFNNDLNAQTWEQKRPHNHTECTKQSHPLDENHVKEGLD